MIGCRTPDYDVAFAALSVSDLHRKLQFILHSAHDEVNGHSAGAQAAKSVGRDQ